MNDDREYVNRAKSGDQRAFRKLYDLHAVPLYRFLHNYSKDRVNVEDWVERAFIKAYLNIGSYNATARFSTWLFTIALNEMRSDVRRPSLVVLESNLVTENWAAEREDDSFLWDDMMKTWLNELDESKRMVFILYEVEGFSHAEIAAILNIGESLSRTLLHRARKQLQLRWNTEEKSA